MNLETDRRIRTLSMNRLAIKSSEPDTLWKEKCCGELNNGGKRWNVDVHYNICFIISRY